MESRSPTLQVDSLPGETPEKPKNTGVGSHSLLQWIFLTQESNRGLLHCRQILYQLSYQGSPIRKPNRDSRENELNTRHFCYLNGFCYQYMSCASTHCRPLREVSLMLQWWSWPWVPSSQQSLQIEIMFIKTLCKTESALEMSAIIHSNCISASSIPSLNNSFTSLQTHRHFFNFLFL